MKHISDRPGRSVLPAGLTILTVISLLAASCGSSTDVADATAGADAIGELESDPAVEDAAPGDDNDDAEGEEPAVAPAPTTTSTSSTTTTTSTTTSTTTTTLAPSPVDCAAQVPLEQRVGQLMFPVMVQSEFEAASELAAAGLLGGVVVLGAPDLSIPDDIAAYQERSLYGPGIIAVDEEGGRVQRLDQLTSSLPSAETVAATLTLAEAQQLAEDHARAIGELGFTMNLAPVVDIDNGGFITDRAFSSDAEVVTDYAFATADGILAAGLDPVVKHFPGHGRGIDSHTGLPTIPNVDVLLESDLVPFVEAIERGDLPIMVGHLVVEGLTGDEPASISAEAIDGLLRTELGFDGLVMTDALNMDAISTTLNNAEAAEQSLAAGVDLIMLGSVADTNLTIEGVLDAVENGRITEQSISESFARVMSTRGIDPCALTSDE